MAVCPSCKEKKRIRWPEHSPVYCTKNCGEDSGFMHLMEAESPECPACGQVKRGRSLPLSQLCWCES